jgi:hypothetical protein
MDRILHLWKKSMFDREPGDIAGASSASQRDRPAHADPD